MSGLLYPRMGFHDFTTRYLKIKQGEHTTFIKPTGGGKSTIIGAVLPTHAVPDQVVFVTKLYDETFSAPDSFFSYGAGWHRVEQWSEVKNYMHKVLLWPKHRSGDLREYARIQKRIFQEAINAIAVQTGWTVICDEEHYLCKTLGLSPEVEWMHHQGRSSGITAFTGIQRPKFVPLITYSSATHAFVGKTTDRDDLKRLTDLGGVDAKRLAHNLARLGPFDFTYIPTRDDGKIPVIVNTRK